MAEEKKGSGFLKFVGVIMLCGVGNMVLPAIVGTGSGGCSSSENSGKPAPYVNGQPGFQTLDSYTHDNNGKVVPNEEKALMRDAANKFEAAQERRRASN